MKKFIIFVIAILLLATPAYALSCKTGTSGNSDECWTTVRVSTSETTPVIPGMLLMYDFLSSPDASTSAYQVRVSDASTNEHYLAGFAQQKIATGDYGLIQVRGQGKVRLDAAAVSSGDDLYASATDGTVRTDSGAGSRDRVIAFALAAGSASTTADAYITLV